jgi:hypothetical protein
VSFIGAAGLDVRNLAAGILFGNELRRPRIKRLGNVATEALQQARKEKLARVDAAKDISKIVEKQVKAELEALGAASIIEIAAALINEKSAVESNGKSTTPGNGKSAAKFKKTGAATPTSPKLAAMKST